MAQAKKKAAKPRSKGNAATRAMEPIAGAVEAGAKAVGKAAKKVTRKVGKATKRAGKAIAGEARAVRKGVKKAAKKVERAVTGSGSGGSRKSTKRPGATKKSSAKKSS